MAESISPPPLGSDTGIPSHLGAGLCAIFVLLGGIIFYFIEKRDQLIRHWAVQSIFFGGTWFAFRILVGVLHSLFRTLPGIGGLMNALLLLVDLVGGLLFLVLWIIGIIKALQGARWEYPYISEYCKRLFPKLA
jgi:uncharacterized membrane protein